MNSKSWDKILLLLVGLVVIGLSGLFITKAMSFGERFSMEPGRADNTLPPTDVDLAILAQQFVETSQLWKTKDTGNPPKPVPLFVSIPIVESDGEMIDMVDPNAKKLRPPVTNLWLRSNNLDYLNAGVLNQDPDGDGFTSLAEWEAKTDPTDSESHPPYAEKLVMLSRQQQEYKLKFSARPDDQRFQIMRIPTRKWPQRDNFYLRVGETSEDEQFRLDSFEVKEAQSGAGIKVDATVLTITYLPKNEEHKIIRNIEYTVPTYFTQLEFLLDPGNPFYVKEGETFNLVLDPDTKYRVVKVEEDSTTVTYQTGSEPEQTVEIKKK